MAVLSINDSSITYTQMNTWHTSSGTRTKDYEPSGQMEQKKHRITNPQPLDPDSF
jgi:hypothetical protein